MTDTIAVTGNIATVPEHRRTTTGLTITSFRLATSRRKLDRDSGEWTDTPPNYYSVSAFRSLGEHAFASLKKGERVIVTGRVKIREWENDAKKGITVEIDADSVGHDLRWGTTTFHPADDGRRDAAQSGDGAAEDETSRPDGDEWSAPGLENADDAPRRDAATESPTPF